MAVISNGTAVLGLGDIGALAGKPVMEGKGLLFKTFADIDVFDIEVDTHDADEFIWTVKNISPTFGGINLEDIKAPECFVIEERLRSELDIPVMHDDPARHGHYLRRSPAQCAGGGRKEDRRRSGRGERCRSRRRLLLQDVHHTRRKADNLVMCDSKGVIRRDRPGLDGMKAGSRPTATSARSKRR